MVEALKSFDESLFLFLNSYHNSFFDQMMWLFSDRFFWIPLYAWLLWILYRQFPKRYWTVLVAITLLIIASDQLCNLAKVNVMRLRPSQEPHLQAMVHFVKGYTGGMYGFYSAHSSNAFAVALFIIKSAARKRWYIILVPLLYAFLTAYSRIYLGVHYPGDVMTGMITGAILGTAFALIHKKIRARYFLPKN